MGLVVGGWVRGAGIGEEVEFIAHPFSKHKVIQVTLRHTPLVVKVAGKWSKFPCCKFCHYHYFWLTLST
jgi:hypothetical protein